MPALIISCIVFGITLFLILTSISLIKSVHERQKMIAILKSEQASIAAEESVHGLSLVATLQRRFTILLKRFGTYTKPKREEDLSRVEKLFVRAGFRKRSAVIIFFGVKTLLAIVLPLFYLAILIIFDLPIHLLLSAFLFVLSAALGCYLPEGWLQFSLRKRQGKILESFPDALDLLVICVESGMSLDAAINRVGDEIKLSSPDVSDELRLLALELRAGKSRRDALKNFGARSGLEDVNYLATLLIQTDRLGTSLAQALRVHADSLRVKRYQGAEEKAAKLPVKMMLPLVCCIFPSLFLVVLGPPVLQVIRIFQLK